MLRQAFAGMLWSKQFFHFDVDRWLVGDPSMPAPPPERLNGRNKDWRHLDSLDVLSMPDTWEYPWFASWDLAFHCVALAQVDGDFAKRQLLLLLREWYQHPNGQLPAYEWAFGDANPPVHAWAAFQVFRIDGQRDYEFLKRVLHKLLINFTWWVNRKDEADNNVFEGGFLGLDNIGPIDRGAPMPPGQYLEQSDGTAWMARYCLDLLEIAVTLAMHDRAYEDVATKFFEHFSYIATAMNDQGLWHERDGFYFDVIRDADGSSLPLVCRSMVGLIPMTAVTVLEDEVRLLLPDFAFRMTWFERNKPEFAEVVAAHARLGCSRPAPDVDRRARSAAPRLGRDARRSRVPLAPRGAQLEPLSPRASARDDDRRRRRSCRLRTRGVDVGIVRREFELARAHLVSGELRADRLACAATRATSATTSPSSSRPARATPCRSTRSPTS